MSHQPNQRQTPFSYPFHIPSHLLSPRRNSDPWESSTSRFRRSDYRQPYGGIERNDTVRNDTVIPSSPSVSHQDYYDTTPNNAAIQRVIREAMGDMHISNTEFKVSIDTKSFKPEELDVKVVNEEVIIHGKHEEDNASKKCVSREFTRRYKLPADVDPAKVTCMLSANGVLCVRGPRTGNSTTISRGPVSTIERP